MRYCALILAVGAAVLLAAGCMDYSQKIVIQEDGSAMVVLDGWLDESLTGLSEEVSAETGVPENIFLSEFEGEPGVEITDSYVETNEKTKVEHHHVTVNVESSDALDDLPSFGGSAGNVKWETGGGEATFEQKLYNEPEAYDSAEEEDLMRSLFEGYTWTYEVVMPGPITQTNGTVGADGRTVTWTWPLFDFARVEEIVMTATCEM
ncbi:MAG: hypothetical protein JSW52_10490 [Candidatus Coatesbacteria bacterium]|nr:MAG: hypothetical protein JSW52_10490 [Candidatus Coatesbacteria bacterium]